jgi:KipI family sensor histidine kinase inhibitor
MQVALKAYGENSVLAQHLCESDRRGLCQEVARQLPPGCVESIEGYGSVLFIFKERASIDLVSEWLGGIDAVDETKSRTRLHEIPVIYDGPDLDSVAKQSGLGVSEVVGIHSAPIYTVRMMGFSPGFPYLDGLDERLHLSRKDKPLTRIKPGAVAIGGPHAGIYSVASPGGWHLLGRTDVRLFDPAAARGMKPDCASIFLLSPGDRLRFQPVD